MDSTYNHLYISRFSSSVSINIFATAVIMFYTVYAWWIEVSKYLMFLFFDKYESISS